MTSADLIIHNANVYTVNPQMAQAEAVAVRGNKIAFVGSNRGAMALRGAKTRVVDGGGCTLLPGFNDSNFHLLMGARQLDHLDLSSVQSLGELAAAIREAPSDGKWIQGNRLAYDVVGDGQALTRHHLDALEPHRPMLLMSLDFHTCWANTKALEIAGILHGGEVKAGAELVMGADGLATGQINEDRSVIARHISALSAAETRELVRRAIAQMNRMGITSIHNMDGDAAQMALYANMAADDANHADNAFNLRVYMPYSVTPDTPLAALADEALPLRERYQSGKVRAGSVKFFIDGVVESGTAYMLEPYTTWPDSRGFPLFERDAYNMLIVEADRLGLQVKVHAIGDAGVRMTLDAYAIAQQANGKRDSRHRIEHVELLHNDDLTRFRALGVIAAMQPLHASRPAANHYVNWMRCVGDERYHRSFRWRDLRNLDVPLAFGSDWPVVSFDPYIGLEAALTQTAWADDLPNQAQTLAETIASYTREGAYAEFQEAVKGQIRPGMLADLVLLDCDLFEINPAQIKEVRPLMTICDGQVVFEK
ncbi:MAG: amidohydrolase [Ardenticatenaceae bacterium]